MVTKVVHCRKESYDVYIGRPSDWGNPFSHLSGTLAKYQVPDRDSAVLAYFHWVIEQPRLMKRIPRELKGKTLGCWCAPLRCHGEVLAAIADGKPYMGRGPSY